jgi:hypothetical protein
MTRRRLLVALGLVVAVVLAACGVPDEEEPRELAAEDLPADLLEPQPTTPGSTTPGGVTAAANIYFMGTERLVAVERRVDPPPDPAEVIILLLEGPTSEEQDLSVSTEIPPETELLDATLSRTGVLTIDLSEEINDIRAEAQQRAIAQLVFTATDLEEVAEVRFEVEGEAKPVPVGDGRQESSPGRPARLPRTATARLRAAHRQRPRTRRRTRSLTGVGVSRSASVAACAS